jgi:hemerythrin-like domain-containing protein
MERYVKVSQDNRQDNRQDNILLKKAYDFIRFIQEFADDYHHAKEEYVLFKYLQVPGVLSHCNPLPVMMSEHEKGRIYVSNMKVNVTNNNYKGLCENIYGYCQLLKQHILKEDQILYPMAEEGVSDEDKLIINSLYKQIEERFDKQIIWDEFEVKYSELENFLNSVTQESESTYA